METSIKKAIQLSIKGGWKDTALDVNTSMSDWPYPCTLDPLFWQALGKAMGWESKDVVTNSAEYREWQGQWHRFIDHLAEGKSPDDFFQDLLTSPE